MQEYILVKPPTSFTRCGYGCLARGVACSKHSHATKPPFPIIFSSHNHQHGAKIRQEVPLISNEELSSKTQATTDSYSSSVLKAPLNDIASDPLAQPQYLGSYFYDPWFNPAYQSMPDYGELYQAPMKSPSGLLITPQSFFTTFPPVPISLRQVIFISFSILLQHICICLQDVT